MSKIFEPLLILKELQCSLIDDNAMSLCYALRLQTSVGKIAVFYYNNVDQKICKNHENREL